MSQIIDLRSDTVTQPTARMRNAMMDAPLGDDITGVIDSLESYGLLSSPLVDSNPDMSGFQISGDHTITWDQGVGVVRVFDSDGFPCDW